LEILKQDGLLKSRRVLLVSKIVDKKRKPSSGGGGESRSRDGEGP
jgi:hypothetical protein